MLGYVREYHESLPAAFGVMVWECAVTTARRPEALPL